MKKLCSLCLISFKHIGKKVVICEDDQPFCYRLLAKKLSLLLCIFLTNSSLLSQKILLITKLWFFSFITWVDASTKKLSNAKMTFVSIATCLCVRIILWPEMNKLWEVMRTQDGPVPIKHITCKLWFSRLYEQIFCFVAWNRDIYNKTAIVKNRIFKKNVKIIKKMVFIMRGGRTLLPQTPLA